jgi:hypothetical protein
MSRAQDARRIAEIQARVHSATHDTMVIDGKIVHGWWWTRERAEFAVNALADIPWLVDRCAQLETQLTQASESLTQCRQFYMDKVADIKSAEIVVDAVRQLVDEKSGVLCARDSDHKCEPCTKFWEVIDGPLQKAGKKAQETRAEEEG